MIVVPYVAGMLHPDTSAAVMAARMPWQCYELPAGDPHRYAALMIALWADRNTIIICEQDTVPPPGAMQAMAACPAQWCTVPHPVGGAPCLDLLGCTKLGRDLMIVYPQLAVDALYQDHPVNRLVGYRQVALRMTAALRGHGMTPCAHAGQTVHHQRSREDVPK